MGNLLLGEPLLEDKRIHKIASKLSVEFPALIDFNSEFVSWIQEPQQVKTADGLAREIPHVAVLAVISDNPRHNNTKQLTRGAMWLEAWVAEDSAFSKLSKQDDPALKLYRPIVKSHLDNLENQKAMMN